MSLETRVLALIAEADLIEQRLADSALTAEDRIGLGRQFSNLEHRVSLARRWQELADQLAELAELKADSDPEIVGLAHAEDATLRSEQEQVETRLRNALLPSNAQDARDAVLEIRAGTGGEEAGLFARDLFRMYTRYAAIKGWTVELVEISEDGLGAISQVVAFVRGSGCFGRLKYESGVHRVQRVPTTESSGRIHTSAATVAILPEAEDLEITISNDDLRIDTYRAQGAGGQHVNKTESAVRITHIPSGVVAQCQDDKSQHQNRARAMVLLKAKLFDQLQAETQAARASMRRDLIGSGDRSQRIRTYNFPQSRVTDHRINLTLHRLEAVLAGDGLDPLIDALREHDEQLQIAGE